MRLDLRLESRGRRARSGGGRLAVDDGRVWRGSKVRLDIPGADDAVATGRVAASLVRAVLEALNFPYVTSDCIAAMVILARDGAVGILRAS